MSNATLMKNSRNEKWRRILLLAATATHTHTHTHLPSTSSHISAFPANDRTTKHFPWTSTMKIGYSSFRKCSANHCSSRRDKYCLNFETLVRVCPISSLQNWKLDPSLFSSSHFNRMNCSWKATTNWIPEIKKKQIKTKMTRKQSVKHFSREQNEQRTTKDNEENSFA